jgi:hypothetical protein
MRIKCNVSRSKSKYGNEKEKEIKTMINMIGGTIGVLMKMMM